MIHNSKLISNIDVYIFSGNLNMLANISKYKTPAFLPILNKSILSYQLEFLERNNIKYFKLITYEEHRHVFEEFFNQNIQRLKFEVIYLPSTEEETDIFSLIKDTITKNNFILISCDSILNFDLFEFIDNHFEKKSLVSFILNDNFSNISNKKLSFMKDNNQLSLYYVNNEDCIKENKRNINEENNLKKVEYCQIVDVEEKNNLKIQKNTLRHCKNLKLLYAYEDISFYIFNKNIFKIIESEQFKEVKQKKSINNLSNDFIPFLINKTYSKTYNELLNTNKNEKIRISINTKIIDKNNEENEFIYKIYDFPSLFLTIEEIQKPYDKINEIFFQTEKNLKHYFSNFANLINDNLKNNKKFNEGIKEIQNISEDCYIADGNNIFNSDCIITKVVSGKNLQVDEKSKIINCLIFDDVKIGKNCKIINSIIGENCIIEDNCELNECIVETNYKVETNTKKNGELINEYNYN